MNSKNQIWYLLLGVAFGLVVSRSLKFYEKYQDLKIELAASDSLVAQKNDSILLLTEALAKFQPAGDSIVMDGR
ncbi:hypothetical protein CVU83_01505 [Candidatus Falkowbacteria bacterium HGW-Falkowbacteria-2]|uniref:Uncharacterized protein n=1 Tax=Candidatus Falkowbacteria bacterium HGW-Falkowbacteria-2 TaxID=2013769 RepID=A0A2N2E1H2_9BACT|nr:MAG: hypothetical protein CVU83_01505 [Candidatus Falkowbacteria bacterium HGW-Falkowbacteria-2]